MVITNINGDKERTAAALLSNILNGKNFEMSNDQPSPSQLQKVEVAPKAAFRFLINNRDMKKTLTRYVSYRPAQIYRGKKWFVYYWFYHEGKFHRFKVYENINRVPLSERMGYAIELKDAVNYHLEKGFNPFEEDLKIVVKNWTVIQGLNFFKQNLPNRGLRKRTEQTYGSVLKFLYAYLPMQTPIKELSKIQVNAIFREAYKKKKWSNVTFNNYITLTKAIWNYLIEEEVTDSNPIKVKPLPENITKHKYFSDAIFQKIKEKAPADLLRFIMFLYHTGTRPNEARQLKYEHILRERKLLFIPASISKNKKDDYVPLSGYVLDNYMGKGFIFGTSVNYFGQKFNELKTELKLDPNTTLYAVKHTAAMKMATANVPPYEMMKFFRHSGLQITMAYLRGLGLEVTWAASEALNQGTGR